MAEATLSPPTAGRPTYLLAQPMLGIAGAAIAPMKKEWAALAAGSGAAAVLRGCNDPAMAAGSVLLAAFAPGDVPIRPDDEPNVEQRLQGYGLAAQYSRGGLHPQPPLPCRELVDGGKHAPGTHGLERFGAIVVTDDPHMLIAQSPERIQGAERHVVVRAENQIEIRVALNE